MSPGLATFLGDLIYSIIDINPYPVCAKDMANPGFNKEWLTLGSDICKFIFQDPDHAVIYV